jgi:transcriptional regulator with XRE-family HTH domain
MTLLDSDFGERVRRMRQQRALTQRELADRARISEATLIRLERGQRPPRPTTLRKLARALGVKPLELTTDG